MGQIIPELEIEMMPVKPLIPLTIAILWGFSFWAVAQVDHSPWDELLERHVKVLRDGQASQLDYAGVLRESEQLTRYLGQLSAVDRGDFDAWSLEDQLAFLINAYNAWTVELVLQQEPGLSSIRDVGLLPKAAWRRKFVNLFGEQISLDEIEHGMIRGWDRYYEPRIHFALNCAAIGCPALRNEAYIGPRLEQQLEEATQRFLSDRTRNYPGADRLYLSPIFDWYREDFEESGSESHTILDFLAHYSEQLGLSRNEVYRLGAGSRGIRYTDYDWGLNRVP